MADRIVFVKGEPQCAICGALVAPPGPDARLMLTRRDGQRVHLEAHAACVQAVLHPEIAVRIHPPDVPPGDAPAT